MVLCHHLDVKQKKELVICTEVETVRIMWLMIHLRGSVTADTTGATILIITMVEDSLSGSHPG